MYSTRHAAYSFVDAHAPCRTAAAALGLLNDSIVWFVSSTRNALLFLQIHKSDWQYKREANGGNDNP